MTNDSSMRDLPFWIRYSITIPIRSLIQKLLNICYQLNAVSAGSPAACVGDSCQILSYHHFSQPKGFCQSGGRNIFRGFRQDFQVIQVIGQSVQQPFRYGIGFHCAILPVNFPKHTLHKIVAALRMMHGEIIARPYRKTNMITAFYT